MHSVTSTAYTGSARDDSIALATADAVTASAKSWKAADEGSLWKVTNEDNLNIIHNNNNNETKSRTATTRARKGSSGKFVTKTKPGNTADVNTWILISLQRKKCTARAAVASIATKPRVADTTA